MFGTIGASLQTILGGNITLLTNLCERTRADAFDLMLQHAAELGANAVWVLVMMRLKSCRASPRCWPMEWSSRGIFPVVMLQQLRQNSLVMLKRLASSVR